MNKQILMMAALLSASTIAMAQDTYINDRLTATDDVNGSARYVGMGGALGALGADLSVIGSNPAGIGLYRKSEIGLTFGAVVPNNTNGWDFDTYRSNSERLARGSFDQLGFVWNMKVNGDVLKHVNVAINYQKKANYNMGFYADSPNLNGLSQMDQVAELADAGFDTDYNLAGLALDNNFLSKDAQGVFNGYRGDRSEYTRHQRGGLKAYDFNIAFNIKDRFYTGLTFGIDDIDYLSWSTYYEQNTDPAGQYGDYTLYNNREVDGTGLNVKLGFIARPIEDSPLRIGLAIESPTWYRMKSSVLYDLTDNVDNVVTEQPESYLEYTVRTPWRTRVSLGSTVDRVLAWGVEYEYANMSKTVMGYPTWEDDGYHNSFASTKDLAMNDLTNRTIRGQHTAKVGMEIKPVDPVAIRVGYNFISKRYKDNPTFDQSYLDSHAMNYQTSTDFMTLGPTNIVTFGLGYKYKKFYADLAYKYRMQSGKFYPFDDSFAQTGEPFAVDYPQLADASIRPVDLNLNRHQVQLSLGFKF